MTATRSMVLLAIAGVAFACGATRMAAESPKPAPVAVPRVDFASQIRPFLETNCAPCHFEGGKMYGPLPFDSGATIRLLGADKMFTRVKDEQQRALIRAYLSQPS